MYKDYTEFTAAKDKCRDCPIGLLHNRVFHSTGNTINPTHMVISSSSVMDDITSERADIFLQNKLKKYGLNESNTLVTSTIPCKLETEIFPGDTYNLISNCMNKWLIEEIHLTKPKYVLLLGPMVCRCLLLAAGPVRDLRGQLFESLHIMAREGSATFAFSDRYNIYVKTMVTFHPRHVIRNFKVIQGQITEVDLFDEDIKKFSELGKQ